jgi:2-iminobutanoate/2-iminopropanoate deaminase
MAGITSQRRVDRRLDDAGLLTGAMTVVHNPQSLYPPYSNYAHVVEVPTGSRTLYISGLNAFASDGVTMPEAFGDQARLIWHHLKAVLAEADMTYRNLVSLRFYLADPADDPENVEILKEHLGDHQAARTVICCRLLEPAWLLEIEAVAAASR